MAAEKSPLTSDQKSPLYPFWDPSTKTLRMTPEDFSNLQLLILDEQKFIEWQHSMLSILGVPLGTEVKVEVVHG